MKKTVRPRTRASKSLPLSDEDRELLELVESLERIARSVRTLVEHPEKVARMYGPASVARQKAAQRLALARMRTAWRGVRVEDGAPYRDARMLLTEGIVFYAACENNAPSSDESRGRAHALARRIASFYPELAARLEEPARIESIRLAILAKSSRRTMPWKQIAATWGGIQAATDRWRQDWDEFRKRTL